MTTQEYGVMVPNKLMSTYKYKYMSMALTVLMHTHEYKQNYGNILIRANDSRLFNGGEIHIWRLVPPVGHYNGVYVGSGKGHHWRFSQEDPDTLGSSKYKYYVPHLLNEPFPKIIGDFEVVKNYLFPLMYPGFNVWKKVGNSCSAV